MFVYLPGSDITGKPHLVKHGGCLIFSENDFTEVKSS